jgi:hypothetical protein
MAAELEEVGAGNSGQQVQGVVKQYQLSGTGSASGALETITPYDSGTILGTVPPGKAGLKLVDGTVQRAAQIIADGTPGAVGNALVSTYSTLNTDPVPPAGSQPADGLSQAPNHE